MRRAFEMRIVSLNSHRVTGRAERISRSVMIDHVARNNGHRADRGAAKQQSNEHPPFNLH